MFGLTRLAVVGGAASLALTAGLAAAFADPGADSAVNTTCSYGQVVAAMNDKSPGIAAEFNAMPAAQSWLKDFLAAPTPRRQQMVDEAQGSPDAARLVALFGPLATSCATY